MEIIHNVDFVLPIAIGLFFAIIFIQSGLDKIFDWKGNLGWLKGHFEKTFIGPMITPLLGVITFFEIAAGIISLVGVGQFMFTGSSFLIKQGLILSIIALLMLIFGQRLAKDYEGAKTIAIYFGVAILSAFILM